MLNRAHLLVLPTLAAALALTASPATAQPGDLDEWTPVDYTEYLATDAEHSGGLYFRPPDGRNCAFHWNSGPVGCDAVSLDAPAGTNQIRASIIEPAHFVTADHPTFTHPNGAKTLPEGHKVTFANTTCGVGYQGTVDCETGDHGFILSAVYSILH